MSKIIKVVNGKLEGYEPDEPPSRESDQSKIGVLSSCAQSRIRKALSAAQVSSDRKSFRGDPSEIMNPVTREMDNIVNGEHGPLLLKVKRGKKILEPHYCAQCKTFEKSLWRYQNSNYGVVFLCAICKTTAFERTYGHADAMPLKLDHAHAHKGKW
ncbi:hypothetical protein ACSTLM_04485 [Vibrio parahaemolyticus]